MAAKKTFIIVYHATPQDKKNGIDAKSKRIVSRAATLHSALKKLREYPKGTCSLFLKEGRGAILLFKG